RRGGSRDRRTPPGCGAAGLGRSDTREGRWRHPRAPRPVGALLRLPVPPWQGRVPAPQPLDARVDFIRYGWGALQARIHGHEHTPSVHATQYGPKTAFGVGMIHGVGAETGSQALLLA